MGRQRTVATMTNLARRTLIDIASAGFLLGACLYAGTVAKAAVDANAPLAISQKGREFRPGAIKVAKGTLVRIVNDDEGVRHHAYVEDAAMPFDSGDQEPGTHADITFAERGEFQVMCAIHPKMRLDVTVE